MAQGDSLTGATLGDYEILEELGRGGMGVVYKAHDRKMDRVVALKVLPSQYARDPLFVQRFEREARAAAGLNHPNTVRVFAVGEDRGLHFIAMQFVEGRTLKQHIAARGRLGVSEALTITRQVAAALSEAHDHGLIHRDIKPGNIMLDHDGWAVLMDFGLAKGMQSSTCLTAQGVQVGTALYMSPEQVRGKPLDGRTDLYSLGLTLYEMLVGEPPFEPAPLLAVMYQVLKQKLPDVTEKNSDVPPVVLELLANMTAKEAEKRYVSAADLCADLDAVAQGVEPPNLAREAPPPPSLDANLAEEVLGHPVPRGTRTWWYLVGVGVATMFVLAITAMIGLREDPVSPGTAPALSSNASGAGQNGRPEPEYPGKPAESRVTNVVIEPPKALGEFAGGHRVGETQTIAGIEMVWIPPGEFMMGSWDSPQEVASKAGGEAEHYSDEQPLHPVTLAKGFWIGKYEVTQAQWMAVMGSDPFWKPEGSSLPADYVSWDDCQEFIWKLNAKNLKRFRLPTEAEWEYACRAGTTTPFHFGETISTDQVNYNPDYLSQRSTGDWQGSKLPVGSFPPNPWGLHDMHGNVEEWCQDWEGDYPSGSVTDPTGPSTGSRRVYRGGSWTHDLWQCRSANRSGYFPDGRLQSAGFRLARD